MGPETHLSSDSFFAIKSLFPQSRGTQIDDAFIHSFIAHIDELFFPNIENSIIIIKLFFMK